MNKINLYMKQFLLTATIFSFTMAIGLTTGTKKHTAIGHSCPFPTCPYKGKTVYVHAHTGAANEPTEDTGSDCDIIDRIHWLHPDWSYDQCETAMMED